MRKATEQLSAAKQDWENVISQQGVKTQMYCIIQVKAIKTKGKIENFMN